MTSQNKSEYIKRVLKEIYFTFDRKKIKKELMDHMEDLEQDFLSSELDVEKREKLICEEMGDPTVIGKVLNQIHNPWLGYLWLISRILMLCLIFYSASYFGTTYAQRSLYSTINDDSNLIMSDVVHTEVLQDYNVHEVFMLDDYKVIFERIFITDKQQLVFLIQDIRPLNLLKPYTINHEFYAYSSIELADNIIIKPDATYLFELYQSYFVVRFDITGLNTDEFIFMFEQGVHKFQFNFNQGDIQ